METVKPENQTDDLTPTDVVEEKIPAFAAILEKRHRPHDWKMLLQKTGNMMVLLGNDNALKLSDLDSIEIPVTVSVGDEDNMVTLSETKDVCERLKNGHLHIFEETQHPIEKVDVGELSKQLALFF